MPDETRDLKARMDLEAHTLVCTERYGSLWAAITDVKNGLGELKTLVRDSETAMHARYTSVSTRLWQIMIGVCGAAIGGVAVLTFYLLTRGKI